MAMTMNGEYQLPVSRETVWAMLNDTETLKACIPGCELFDKLSDTEFQAVAVTKIGPVKARFKGKVIFQTLIHRTATKFPVRATAAWQASRPAGRR